MAGGAYLDWGQCRTVLHDFHGIEPTGEIHRKLRICIGELLTIESERRESKTDG